MVAYSVIAGEKVECRHVLRRVVAHHLPLVGRRRVTREVTLDKAVHWKRAAHSRRRADLKRYGGVLMRWIINMLNRELEWLHPAIGVLLQPLRVGLKTFERQAAGARKIKIAEHVVE